MTTYFVSRTENLLTLHGPNTDGGVNIMEKEAKLLSISFVRDGKRTKVLFLSGRSLNSLSLRDLDVLWHKYLELKDLRTLNSFQDFGIALTASA